MTRAYVEGRVDRPWTAFEADPDAEYERVIDIDLGKVDCTVAWPHLPENAHSAREGSDIAIDQIVIGSCTNGQLPDMAAAAAILRGHHLGPERPRHHHPRHAGSLPRLHARGLHRYFPRRGLHASPRPHAGRASAAIWAFSPPASAAFPPPTATLWAAWAMSTARSTSPLRLSPRRLVLPATFLDPEEVMNK